MDYHLKKQLLALYEDGGWYARTYAKYRSPLLNLSGIIPFLPEEGTIIELGCGPGLIANYISLSLPSARIIGIDLDPKKIGVARETIKDRANVTFILHDVTQELPSGDGVIMSDFLHHLPRERHCGFLENIYRHLNGGGVLVIEEINPDEKEAWRYWLSYLADVVLYPFSEKCNFRRPGELTGMLRETGFSVESFPHRIPVFSRIIYICRKK